MYERVEECRPGLPAAVTDLLANSISVNTGYTSRILVSFLTRKLRVSLNYALNVFANFVYYQSVHLKLYANRITR